MRELKVFIKGAKMKKHDGWNKCCYCGKFIKYNDFVDKKAENIMVLPESICTNETWETYHVKCREQDILRQSKLLITA